ncbi:MAG: triacylglycerol lipase [Myxococcota bacterium]|nr:triacylglycerol lipase [Myxococcota bacterium]
MPRPHHVFLIPGFFGFANLGQITYFGHVRRALVEQLAARDVDAHVHVVRTHPTASLSQRAARLVETIAATAPGRDAPIHLIGHSTGGLDARLAVSPGVVLPTRAGVERFAARVRSVVTVATPHRGTPIAAYFATLRGQRLLQLLSLGTMHLLHFGRVPLTPLLRVTGALVRADEAVASSGVVDALFARLLEDFSVGRRRAVRSLLREVVLDQSLLLQLTPEAMEVFAAAVGDRPGVRGGSVVTQAAMPSLRSRIATGLDAGAQASYAIYGALHRLAATVPRRNRVALSSASARVLRRAFGSEPGVSANDGIVPTRSQASWGRLVHAARADHLDVLGHFRSAEPGSPHVDWLASGSGFDRPRFDALWRDVARFVAGASR